MSRKKSQPVVNGITEERTMLKTLQQDNVYPSVELQKLSDLTGFPVNSKFSTAIVSEGTIVNVVSDAYGLLKNEDFFPTVEENLAKSNIQYDMRSINRKDSHFAVDYILNDPSYHVDIKNGMDIIKPMLRFSNSYAGGPTTGRFGFFRKMCDNGLHIAQTKVGFGVRHKRNITQVVLPEIGKLVEVFMDNEFYMLKKKFEVLAETPITDLSDFVKYVATREDLFKFETSGKSVEPSKKAMEVMDIVSREASALQIEPNLWLGYNAFNEIIHKSGKTFQEQRGLDIKIFNTVLEMAN